MKRRAFLQTAGATIPVVLNGAPLHTIGKSSLFDFVNEDNDKILVLLQCNGGYDGLNMLVPRDYYEELQAVRSNIILPESSLFPLSNELGLHPKLSSIGKLFGEGQIGFIQSVGYPNQNRSHFRSKDIWLSGSSADEYISTGWLGRYLDTEYPDFPSNYPNADHTDPFAITMGSSISETCQGMASNFGMTINDPFNLTPLTISDGTEVPDNYYGRQLNFLRDVMIKSNEYAEVVKTAAAKGSNKVEYPDYGLAKHLRNVSLLIAGGLRTKIYVVNLGGFDTHANQTEANDPTGGRHGRLLAEMSASLESFQKDLIALGLDQRVLTLAYTEFGRRIRSNGSLGTDHGSAAPLILMGTCAQGQILGENVQIDTEVGDKDGVPMQFDFRSVYGTILQDWFEVPENRIENYFTLTIRGSRFCKTVAPRLMHRLFRSTL